MSIFNIKLKTKSGNDVKKKETFTVFFRLNYKKTALSKKPSAVEYTYRIITSAGTIDPQVVLQLKNADEIMSIEDLTLKVILNLCHIIGKHSQFTGINPDFVIFISPDLNGKRNKSWHFLKDVFWKAKPKKDNQVKTDEFLTITEEEELRDWDENDCEKIKIKKPEFDLLKDFVVLNPGCHFMAVDPYINVEKYAKSIHLCGRLQDRIDRKVQITEESNQVNLHNGKNE